MRDQLRKKALEWRVCRQCGAWPSIPQTDHCRSCWGALMRMAKPQVIRHRIGTIRCLFQWRKGESDRLSGFLRSLKGGRSRQIWHQLAEIFLRRHFLEKAERLAAVNLVPIPSRPLGCRDHAFYWAEGLSRWGPSFQPHLLGRSDDVGAQKEKRQLERQNIKLWSLAKDHHRVGSKVFILADDVVTTGGTVKAAQVALESLRIQEVWCLAYRQGLNAKTLL